MSEQRKIDLMIAAFCVLMFIALLVAGQTEMLQ